MCFIPVSSISSPRLRLGNSYFHMSSAVRSLFRYEAEILSTRRQPSAAKQAEYLKTDSARILNNIFRVRLGKILKNINLLYILRLSLTDVKLGI
jgi:hypothetical protein